MFYRIFNSSYKLQNVLLSLFLGKHGTLGKMFVFNFPQPNFAPYPPTVMISTPSITPVSVNVSVPGINFFVESTTSREKHAAIDLTQSTYLSLDSYVQNKTVIISANGEVSVYGTTSYGYNGEGFMALPTHALGKKYMILAYTPSSVKPSGPTNAEFSVSALEKETYVQITLPDQRQISITLKAYQSYQVNDKSNDLSGSFVEANEPIAVMAGNIMAEVPKGSEGDDLLEQLPSIDNFGQNFVLAPFQGRTNGYVYRVISSTKVNITITNIGSVDIEAGEFYEGGVLDDSITFISSDKPILVAQFMNGISDNLGDTAMVVVPPTEMFAGNITFPVYGNPRPTIGDYEYHISIIAQCSDGQGLIYDDDSLLNNGFDTKSRDGMCVFRSKATPGMHDLKHMDPDVTFSVVVYGYRDFNAYAYHAGFNVISGKLKYVLGFIIYRTLNLVKNIKPF